MNESRDTPPPLMKRSPEIERLWRTNGYLAFVQTRETHAHAIAEGWVDKGKGRKKSVTLGRDGRGVHIVLSCGRRGANGNRRRAMASGGTMYVYNIHTRAHRPHGRHNARILLKVSDNPPPRHCPHNRSGLSNPTGRYFSIPDPNRRRHLACRHCSSVSFRRDSSYAHLPPPRKTSRVPFNFHITTVFLNRPSVSIGIIRCTIILAISAMLYRASSPLDLCYTGIEVKNC